MHLIRFEHLFMLRHKTKVVRWLRIEQPSQRSSAKTAKLAKLGRGHTLKMVFFKVREWFRKKTKLDLLI